MIRETKLVRPFDSKHDSLLSTVLCSNLMILHEPRMGILFYFECCLLLLLLLWLLLLIATVGQLWMCIDLFVSSLSSKTNIFWIIILFSLDLVPCMRNTIDIASASTFQWNFVVKIYLSALSLATFLSSILFPLSSAEQIFHLRNVITETAITMDTTTKMYSGK